MFRGPMHMCEIVGFDGARREPRFETTAVATNAEAASDIEGHVAEVACNAGRTMQNDSINHGSATYPRAQRQQHHISATTGCTPQDFGQQRGSRIVVTSNQKIFDSDQLCQQCSLQKLQSTRNIVDARCCWIDNPTTSDTNSFYWSFGFLEAFIKKIPEFFAASWRWLMPAFEHLSGAADNSGLDGGCADIDTESGREARRIRLVQIHSEFALYGSRNRNLVAVRS
jgi:hypothetical protein